MLLRQRVPTSKELISLLAEGRLRSQDSLAQELGVFVRTLKRHVYRIMKAGWIFSIPRLNYRCMQPGVPAGLVVLFANQDVRGGAEAKGLELIDESFFYASVWGIVRIV